MNRPSVHDAQRPIQFRLKWCFAAVAVAAVLLAINAWLHGIPWRIVAPNGKAGYLAIASFAIVYYYVVFRPTQEMAHGWFVIAWCLAIMDIVVGFINSFQVIGNYPPKPSEMLEKYEIVLSGTVLPGLLTISIVWLVLRRGCNPISRAGCWFTVAVMLAFVDVVLIAILTASIFGAAYWAW